MVEIVNLKRVRKDKAHKQTVRKGYKHVCAVKTTLQSIPENEVLSV